MLKKHKWLFLAVLYTVFVFVISLIKVKKADSIDLPYFDKIVHLGIYFIFTIVWFLHFVKAKFDKGFSKGIIKSSILSFAVGVIVEVLQQITTNARTGEFNDVLANSLGVVIAVLFLYQIKKYKALKSVK